LFGDGKTSTLLSQPTFYAIAFLKAKENSTLRQKLDLLDDYLSKVTFDLELRADPINISFFGHKT
jgi:hypothetical protein